MRQAQAQGEVRRGEEAEEEAGVRERGRRDDLLAGDVDRGEPRDREEADEDEVEELSRPEGQGIASASKTLTRATARSYETSWWSKRSVRSPGESCEARRGLT